MKYVDDKKRQKCDKKQWCNFGDDESCVEIDENSKSGKMFGGGR